MLKSFRMRVSSGSHQGYKLGEEVRGDYSMQCLIKHDKADVGSPLLEAATMQVLDHIGDTCVTVVVVTNIWTISISFMYVCV